MTLLANTILLLVCVFKAFQIQNPWNMKQWYVNVFWTEFETSSVTVFIAAHWDSHWVVQIIPVRH